MDFLPFEKNAIFNWLKAIKKSINIIAENYKEMISNSQKQTELLQKLVEMLENK